METVRATSKKSSTCIPLCSVNRNENKQSIFYRTDEILFDTIKLKYGRDDEIMNRNENDRTDENIYNLQVKVINKIQEKRF